MKETGVSMRLARGLHFFGRITSNLSHEMNNVITIIGEVSGLLDDLLLLAEKGRPLDIGKLKFLSENIKRQTRRGRSLITHMNFFGHSIDDPSKEIDLNQVVDHIETLARRIAERKGVALEATCGDRPVMAVCGPFDLLQSVFLCLDMALGAGAVSEPIRISTSVEARVPCLSIRSAGFEHGDQDMATLSYVGILLAEMGGAVTTTVDDGGHRVILMRFLPAANDAVRVQ